MKLEVNGKPLRRNTDCTVAELLDELAFDARRVAVEVNGELVARERHGEYRLRDADVVEIVSLVGGG